MIANLVDWIVWYMIWDKEYPWAITSTDLFALIIYLEMSYELFIFINKKICILWFHLNILIASYILVLFNDIM